MKPMHNPPHPGEILRELCFEPLGITVTEAAAALGVSRKTLSAILNGCAGITAEMALRLGKAKRPTNLSIDATCVEIIAALDFLLTGI